MTITIPYADFEVLEGAATNLREVVASAESQANFNIAGGVGVLEITGSAGVVAFDFSGFQQDVPSPGFATITISSPDANLVGTPITPPDAAGFDLVVPYNDVGGGDAEIPAHPFVMYNGEPSNIASPPDPQFITLPPADNPVLTGLRSGPSETEIQCHIWQSVDGSEVLVGRTSFNPAINVSIPNYTYTEISELLDLDVDNDATEETQVEVDDSTQAVNRFLPFDNLVVAEPTTELILSWRLLVDMGFPATTGDDGSTIPFTIESDLSIAKARIYPTANPTNFKEFPATRGTGLDGNKLNIDFSAFYPEMPSIAVLLPLSTVADPDVFLNQEVEVTNSRYAGTPVPESNDIDPNIFLQLEDIAFTTVTVDLEFPLDYTLDPTVQISRTDGMGPTIVGALSNFNVGGGEVDLTIGETLLTLDVVYDIYNPETIQPMQQIFTRESGPAAEPPADSEPVPAEDPVQPVDLCLFGAAVALNNRAGGPLINAVMNANVMNPAPQPGVHVNIINKGPNVVNQFNNVWRQMGFNPFTQHIIAPSPADGEYNEATFGSDDPSVARGTVDRWRNFGLPSGWLGMLLPDYELRKTITRTSKRVKNIRGHYRDQYNHWLSSAFLYKDAPGNPDTTSRSRSESGERRWNTPELIDVAEDQAITFAERPDQFTVEELEAYKIDWLLSEFIAYSDAIGEEFLSVDGLDFTDGAFGPRCLGIFGPKHIQFLPYGGGAGDYISRLETVDYELVGRPDNIFVVLFATGPLNVEISLDGGTTWVEYVPGTWSTTTAFPAINAGDTVEFRMKLKNMTSRHIFLDSFYVFYDKADNAEADYLTPPISGIPAGEPDPHPVAADQ